MAASGDRGRFGIPRDDEWIVGGMLFCFVALRVISERSTPLVYFDSGEFRHVHFFGGRRPFTVPMLFALAPSDALKILEQATISVAAWVTLALVVAATLDDRRLRLASIATFLALGLTTQVTNWDTAILSDSIAISLTVFLVAAWVAVYRAPTKWTVAGVLVTTTLWTFARELHVYVTAVIAVIAVVVVIVRRARAPWRVVAAGLVLIGGLGVMDRRSNDETAKENLAGVIGARVLPDHAKRQWFVDAGMPSMPQLAEGVAHPDKELLAIPEFERWAGQRGWVVYARFLLTHPSSAIDGPLRELLEERQTFAEDPPAHAVLLSPAEAYGRSRPVLPPVFEDFLFAPGRTGALLTLAVVTLTACLMVSARRGSDRRSHVPLVVVAASVVYAIAAWHGSVFEPGRHAMPAAIAIRVALIALLAVVADAALAPSDQSDFRDSR